MVHPALVFKFVGVVAFLNLASSVNISHLMDVYHAACGYSSCSVLGKQDYLANTGKCPPCYCDGACIAKGNCCPDVFFERDPKCTNLKIMNFNSNNNKSKESILVIQKCSEENHQSKHLCEKNLTTKDYIQTPIVTSIKTEITYRNVYCGICSNESLDDLQQWSLESYCNTFADFNLVSTYAEFADLAKVNQCDISYINNSTTNKAKPCREMLSNLLVNPCNISGTWSKYDEDIEYACKTYENPFDNFQNIFCALCNPIVYSGDIISSCNASGLWGIENEELETLCFSTTASTFTIPYKNSFCYICNTYESNRSPSKGGTLVHFSDNNKYNVLQTVSPYDAMHLASWISCCCRAPDFKNSTIDISGYTHNEQNLQTFKDVHGMFSVLCIYTKTCNVFPLINCCSDLFIKDNEHLVRKGVISNGTITTYCQSFLSWIHLFYFENVLKHLKLKRCRIVDGHGSPDRILCLPIVDIKNGVTFSSLFSISSNMYKSKTTHNRNCDGIVIHGLSKDNCRQLICFPGRVLTMAGCKVFLKETINIGYILSLELKIDLPKIVENVSLFFNSMLAEFDNFIAGYLNLSTSDIIFESKYLYSNVNCSNPTSWGSVLIVSGYFQFFIKSLIDRETVENELFNITSSGIVIDVSGVHIPVNFDDSNFTLCLQDMHQQKDFKHGCFLNRTSKKTQYQYFPLFVNEVLACKQIEFETAEFEIENQTKIATIQGTNVKLMRGHYAVLTSGKLRVCVERLKRILGSTREMNKIKLIDMIFLSCEGFSLIALVVTFYTYSLFSSLRTLPGKINMCLIFSMFNSHSLFILSPHLSLGSFECIVVGVVMHVFWLSTFGWFNICSFHMFRIFSSKTGRSGSAVQQKKRFWCYCVYGFGLPAIIVGITITISVLLSDDIAYGQDKCSIHGFIPWLLTFFSPLALICFTNIVFFILTARMIASTPNVHDLTETSITSNRKQFSVYTKLFSITGLTWILQLIDGFMSIPALSSAVSILNAFQGVFIFISYVCNIRVLLLYRNIFLKQHQKRQKGKITTFTAYIRSTSSSKTNTVQR